MSTTGMTGKSFKGNLEVLNLSDIFQSLAMNRHSGTLVVTDGKREKKIFFAEGEITLLSSSRRQRLGELLVSEEKITDEDLELALKLQKQSRKRLGEILVEEGFCEEEDIDRLVRHQIQEEIYDLFLWRKAEFEFIADQMPEDMARESPQLTRLAFNTNSLIMEALRRLDEWSLIRDLVPSTKEVFVLTNEVDLDKVDVPARIRNDAPKYVDGKTTVEGLAEKLYISEFELCKHLAELVQAGAARALTQEELADRAEQCYALNDFAGAAALYGRLTEHYPDQPKILTPLADSLRRSGVETQALAIYETLAALLQKSGRDPERLRMCMEAIVQLDPSRAAELNPQLEDMHLRAAEAPSGRKRGPLIAVVVLLVLGGGAFGLSRLRQKPGRDTSAQDVEKLFAEYNKAIEQRDFERWFQLAWQIRDDYPESGAAKKVELPLLVRTVPAGYSVYVNDANQRQTRVGEPYLECTFRPSDKIKVEIKAPLREGEETARTLVGPVYYDDPRKWPGVLEYQVVNQNDLSFGDDLWLDAGVAYSHTRDLFLVPSRTGLLRALSLKERSDGRISVTTPPGWSKVPLGPSRMGDLFSEPQVVQVGGNERLLVGGIEGGVLSLDLPPGEDKPRKVSSSRYQAEGQVRATPSVVSPEQVPGGRVVFGTLHGEVLAYPLQGGQPAWEQRTLGAIEWPAALVTDPQACLFASDDAHLYGYALADGAPLWSPWSSPQAFSGPPQALGGTTVALCYPDHIQAFDVRAGQPLEARWTPPAGDQVETARSDPERRRLAVVTQGGQLVLLDERLQPVWSEPVKVPYGKVCRLAFARSRLIAAWGYPARQGGHDAAARVFDLQDGRLTWQGGYGAGVGTIASPISVWDQGEDGWGFFFGLDTSQLVRFRVSED